jgi:hypothetical protein
MILYLVIVVITSILMLLSAQQDLKERMIYSIPIIVLHLVWSIYLWQSDEWSGEFLVVFWIMHLIIYVMLNHF